MPLGRTLFLSAQDGVRGQFGAVGRAAWWGLGRGRRVRNPPARGDGGPWQGLPSELFLAQHGGRSRRPRRLELLDGGSRNHVEAATSPSWRSC